MLDNFTQDAHHSGNISENRMANGSASSSKTPSRSNLQAPPPPRALSTSPNFLDVPNTSLRARRPSRDSAFSELSELSLYSEELSNQHQHPLLPTNSNEQSESSNNQLTSGTPQSKSRFHRALATFYLRNYGVLLVLCAMFFGSLMNIGIRLLETPGPHGAPMHPYQILFVRQSITAACCSVYGFASGRIPDFPLGPRGVRGLLVFRGLSGFFGVFGMYFSLLYLPLSEATVLTFLAPILTCYACSFLMPGETFTRQQQLAGFLSLLGVVFIAQPASLFKSSEPESSPPSDSDSSSTQTTPHQHLIAIAIAMLGVVGATGAMTAIRAIGNRTHAFISINYFSVWCSIVSLACLAIFPDVKFRVPGNVLEWSILIFLGSAGFAMQWLLTVGLAYGGAGVEKDAIKSGRESQQGGVDLEGAPPHAGARPTSRAQDRARRLEEEAKKGSQTRATSMIYTQMCFALIGDKLVFGVTPTMMSWIGSGLVLAGAIWVAAARDQQKTEENVDGAVELDGPERRLSVVQGGSKSRTSGLREEEVGLMTDVGAGHEAMELDDLASRKESTHEPAD